MWIYFLNKRERGKLTGHKYVLEENITYNVIHRYYQWRELNGLKVKQCIYSKLMGGN